MEPADVVRVLFYLCLAGSLGVYGYRAYRHVVYKETRFDRAERRRAERDAAEGRAPAPTKDATAAKGTTGSSPLGRPISGRTGASSSEGSLGTGSTNKGSTSKGSTSKGSAEAPGRTRGRAEAGATTDRGDAPGGLVEAVIREELEKKRLAEAKADGTGPSATSGAAADAADDAGGPDERAPVRPEQAITVADALAGIELPCELAPTSVDDADSQRVVFATTGFSPRRVRAEIADELERLGYEVGADQRTIVEATRDAGTVWYEVFDDAATVRVGEDRVFPHVPAGSVVVVFST